MSGTKHKHRGPGHSNVPKVNPMLAKIDAAWEIECAARLTRNSEISLIAVMLMSNDLLHVGPGRADIVTDEYRKDIMLIAQEIISATDDDPEMLKPKHDLAKRLKKIYGPEKWEKYKHLFPMVKEYW